MQCPNCGGDTTVSETRSVGKNLMRRRRVCSSCKLRFTTREEIAAPNLRVEKRRGGVEPYDRAKLRRAVTRVCDWRPVEATTVDELIDHVEAQLTKAQARTVRWSRLVELVVDALRGVDGVAARRMQADYLDDTGALRLDDGAEARPGATPPQLGLFEDEE
ncbi:MAG: transcriptional repressor NrdR [Kofleriaceae bacterium]|nr:transcriptional repressor NrdR [Myxococcales bacterium]MCB9560393.1 transcriptional repressor NrdR [Kofleriaceae bacterium]MCB9571677.1 transcriptional repressor NrdR [Kofleriaceae bacterium]